jgi:hypothetical protein
LQSITFQGRINEITDAMFLDCHNLSSVNIPNGVTSIGHYAFGRCFNLQTVHIPDGVTFIGDFAFFRTNNLQTFNLPNSVTFIGQEAFLDARKLTSVTIPNSITQLGGRVFKQTGLTSITVPGNVKEIPFSMCSFCYNLTSVTICEGVKFISDAAFQDGWALETVSLPASLDSIDGKAFGNLYGNYNNLKVIECNGMTPPAVYSEAFINRDLTNVILYVPQGSEPAYRNAPVWKDFPNIVASPPAGN